MHVKSIPAPTLRRLPRYYHYLCRLQEKGQAMISASQMAEDLDVHPTQVRKDLAITGVQGKPKVGSRVDDLVRSIETFLNWNNASDAFLVGAGNLGSALMGYSGFNRAGIRVTAAFDARPDRVGSRIHGVEVLPMAKFKDLVQRMHIAIGIITVPAEGAQEIADLMVQSGIQAIWNFAPTSLDVPDDVIIENVEFYSSLAILSRRLAEHRSVLATLS